VVALVGVGVAFVLSGCGPNTTTVTGKVSHNGKPVVWGSVILVDSKGEFHQGTIDTSGNYRIENMPTGQVKIGVTSPKPPDEKDSKGGGNTGGKGGKGGTPPRGGANMDDPRAQFQANNPPAELPPPPPPGSWFAIPDKYKDPLTSGLTGEVASGKPLDIDLK
jgi:hypothetical protein